MLPFCDHDRRMSNESAGEAGSEANERRAMSLAQPVSDQTADCDALVYSARLGTGVSGAAAAGAVGAVVVGPPVIATLAILVLISLAGIVLACR